MNTTTKIRAAMKLIDPAVRVSGGNGHWTIRFESSAHLDAIRAKAAELGLRVRSTNVEGGRFNWSYAVSVWA